MNFSIRHSKEQGLDLVNMSEETTATEVSLLPGFGASLHAFRVRLRDGTVFNVIDQYKDLSELEKQISLSFKSSKLSPFPCRLAEGRYHFENKEYQFKNLFRDGSAIHGLLYDRPFTIMEENAGETFAMLSLEYHYDREDEGYPFAYSCQVKYTLHSDGLLEVTTVLTNLDQGVLPIADGWHPYFKLGGKTDDWDLQFHSSAILAFDDALIPTGDLLQYDLFNGPRPIANTFLDNCFVLKPGMENPACEISNPANGLRVSFFPGAEYPYLQIYTPSDRSSIAIENLSAAPDCFNNEMGLLLLLPGHSQIFTVRYKVSVG
jgi:aldose 1-epimerase